VVLDIVVAFGVVIALYAVIAFALATIIKRSIRYMAVRERVRRVLTDA
jgi:hypothetical protein